ncbi:hypothetical protein MPLB_1200075 [Mesorhizobium sp. ORS 3324]|nr:hypothetical protein MPLB_1200075 [Mesorhizobium sp. ORS 3324]
MCSGMASEGGARGGPRISGRAVGQIAGAFLPGAVRAAIDDVALLDAMPDDPYPAMRACRSKLLDRALEAVKRVGLPAQAHLECLVVVVAALVALSHGAFLLLNAKNLPAGDRFRPRHSTLPLDAPTVAFADIDGVLRRRFEACAGLRSRAWSLSGARGANSFVLALH